MAPDKRQRIARETLDIYAPIAHRLGLNQTYRELQELSLRVPVPLAPRRRWPRRCSARAATGATSSSACSSDVEKAFAAAKIKVQVCGPREDRLFDLPQDAREARRLRAGQRHLRLSHRRADADRVLPGAGRAAPALQAGAGALQGLHRHPQGQRLPVAAHHAGQPAGHGGGVPDAHRGHARGGREGHRRALALQGQRQGRATSPATRSAWARCGCSRCSTSRTRRATRPSSSSTSRSTCSPTRSTCSRRAARSWRCRAAPRRWTSPTPSTPTSATTCVAAKVNGEPVALRTELRSGDVVEIITAPGARPNPAWLNMVRTGRARSKIRHYLKTMEHDESRAWARRCWPRRCAPKAWQLPRQRPATTPPAAALWQQLTRWSGNRSRGELLVDIGLGRKIAIIVAKRLAQLMAERGMHARRGDADAGPLRPATTARRRRAWSSSTAAKAPRCSWPPAAGRSRATPSSATWAAAKACWCTPPNATSASACSNATASAGCRSNGPRS